MPIAFFGALRAGLVPVPVNILTPPDLVQYYLEHTGARVMVVEETSPTSRGSEAATAGTAVDTAVIANAPSPACGRGRGEGSHPRALSANHPDHLPAADTSRDDMAFWLYSSGSTGRPERASCTSTTTWPTRWRAIPGTS
jgi:acetyl-CoA synthetase